MAVTQKPVLYPPTPSQKIMNKKNDKNDDRLVIGTKGTSECYSEIPTESKLLRFAEKQLKITAEQ